MSKQVIPHHLRSQAVALAHDLLMVPIAWFLAFWFRYNLEVLPAAYYQDALAGLLFCLYCRFNSPPFFFSASIAVSGDMHPFPTSYASLRLYSLAP
ncbi:MAG: hypothetical protein KZQ72_12410 [Candidatus Thiodiazotropha sp. (ex Cardiolucina cf. quadrata)]|nr:hypothetical protein [Candidatus Thiodiazotropha sp. (ex Cardiolucina cf. quadrata)]